MSESTIPNDQIETLDIESPSPLPRKVPRTRQAKGLTRSRSQFRDHPGLGITPEGIRYIYRCAENGDISRMCALYQDIIETDGHLRGLINSRVQAVAGKEWVIQPGGEDPASIAAAQALDRVLSDSINFGSFVEHQLLAPYYGFSASEIDWDLRDGFIAPKWFANVPHKRFLVADGASLRLVTEDNRHDGEALHPGKWVLTKIPGEDLSRAGLMRTVVWWATFKRMAVRDWVIFAEKFGIPHVVGEYDSHTSDDAREALEQAIEDIGEGGQALLEAGTKIAISEIAQRSGSNQTVHPELVAMCEQQISKLINGSTLNSDSGGPGSFALGKVHQGRAFQLELSDSMRLGRVFQEHVGLPFTVYNGFSDLGAKAPRLKIQVVQELDPLTRAKVASIYVNELGGEVSAQQFRDEWGFKAPNGEGDTLKGGVSAPAVDGEPEGGEDE